MVVRLLRMLGSLRVTVGLLTVMIVLSGIALIVPQKAHVFTPEMLYFLRSWGLTNVSGSIWFISATGLLFLNLFASLLARFGEAWRASHESPESIKLGASGGEPCLTISQKTSLQREDFRSAVENWVKGTTGRIFTLKDEGGLYELQLAVQIGRFSQLVGWFAHLSLLIVALGFVLTARYGVEGRVTIDEGKRVDYVQIVKGHMPAWQPYREKGEAIQSFFHPGYTIEADRIETQPHRILTSLNFFEKEDQIAAIDVSVLQPARFRDLSFYQIGFAETTRGSIDILIEDRYAEYQQRYARLKPGDDFVIKGGWFKVLEIEETEEMGTAVRIEFRAERAKPENFWVFSKYPGYDAVSRKNSRHGFQIEKVYPQYRTELAFGKDPGAVVTGIGALLALALIIVSLRYTHRKYWFVWREGQIHIVGWSSPTTLFKPEFTRSAQRFFYRAGKKDKILRQIKPEVQHGSLGHY